MRFIRFEVPEASSVKKYVAVLYNPTTQREVRVPFGDRRYAQYFDKIGRYAHLNHSDPKRKAAYRARHAGEGDERNKYKAGWFAWHYLW